MRDEAAGSWVPDGFSDFGRFAARETDGSGEGENEDCVAQHDDRGDAGRGGSS